jgi:hypothetical protein
LGVLTLGPWIYGLIRGIIPGFAAEPLAASAGAFLSTSPLSAFWFGVLYPAGIAGAVIIGPLITVFMVLVLAWLIAAALLPAAAFPLAALVSVLFRAIGALLACISRFPPVPIGNVRAAAALSLAAVAALYAGQRRLALMRKRLAPFD